MEHNFPGLKSKQKKH